MWWGGDLMKSPDILAASLKRPPDYTVLTKPLLLLVFGLIAVVWGLIEFNADRKPANDKNDPYAVR
jgi:hypothetical protein